jgi:ubiquinone/menaquinone biosynthesis C-methylase UbiE
MTPQPGDRILDVGCGTGAFLASLAHRFESSQLSGVDPSVEMLSVARDRLESNVVLVAARAEELPFSDESFDAVVSTNVFHFLREPRRALGEMRRVLRPGGRLIISDWCDDFLACRLCDLYLRLFSRSHYRMYGTHSCRRLLDETDFSVNDIERFKISWLWGLMCASAVK